MPDLRTSEPEEAMTNIMLWRTIAVVDMVGYSDIAKLLEENISALSVSDLNRQIQSFISSSLEILTDKAAYCVVAKTGDGIIVMFDQADDAHHFAHQLQVLAQRHNEQRSVSTAERWFRIGIATGNVSATICSHLPPEYAGITIANAVRLESSGEPGQITIDDKTFNGLSKDLQLLYGPEEIVRGKRTEAFRARRYALTASPRHPTLARQIVEGDHPPPFKPNPRRSPAVALGLRLTIVITAIIALFISTLLFPSARQRLRGMVYANKQKHVAFLPLRVVGDFSKSQAIGDGLMDSLAGKLSNSDFGRDTLWVVPPSDVRDHKVSSPSSAYRELGATIVVEGSFEQTSDWTVVKLSVVDPQKRREVGFVDLRDRNDNLSALQDQALLQLERLMNVSTKSATSTDRGNILTGEAFQEYLAGLGYFQRKDKPGNLDRAILSLSQALRIDSHFAPGLALIAQAYSLKYRLDSDPKWVRTAEEYSREAVKADGTLPASHVALAQVSQLTGQNEVAVQEFQRALSIDAGNAEATAGIANLYLSQGKVAEAETAYLRAASLRPDDWSVYNDLGLFYDDIGRPKDAISQYHRAIQLTPDNSWPYTNLGSAIVDLDDPKLLEKAEAAFKKSLSLDPTFSAYSDLGLLYAQEHRFEEAKNANLMALKLNDSSADVWINLAGSYDWLGLRDQARVARDRAFELFERIVSTNKQDALAHASLALLYALRGRQSQSLAEIKFSLDISPSDPYVLFQVADAYEALGDSRLAIQSLKDALKRGLSRGQLQGDYQLRSISLTPDL